MSVLWLPSFPVLLIHFIMHSTTITLSYSRSWSESRAHSHASKKGLKWSGIKWYSNSRHWIYPDVNHQNDQANQAGTLSWYIHSIYQKFIKWHLCFVLTKHPTWDNFAIGTHSCLLLYASMFSEHIYYVCNLPVLWLLYGFVVL